MAVADIIDYSIPFILGLILISQSKRYVGHKKKLRVSGFVLIGVGFFLLLIGNI